MTRYEKIQNNIKWTIVALDRCMMHKSFFMAAVWYANKMTLERMLSEMSVEEAGMISNN